MGAGVACERTTGEVDPDGAWACQRTMSCFRGPRRGRTPRVLGPRHSSNCGSTQALKGEAPKGDGELPHQHEFIGRRFA